MGVDDKIHLVLFRIGVGIHDDGHVVEETQRLIAPIAKADIILLDNFRAEHRYACNHIILANHTLRVGSFRSAFQDGLHRVGHNPCHVLAFDTGSEHIGFHHIERNKIKCRTDFFCLRFQTDKRADQFLRVCHLCRAEHNFIYQISNGSRQLFVNDGDSVQKGNKIMAITASYATLLTAERLLLNFMQRMSGIATETHRYVAACEGTNTHILDTRKTAPGLRLLDKMAVRHGGGRNHRMGLYDMIMLKDNHIKAVGSITKAVEMVHSQLPLSVKVEVETTCLKEVEEALSAGADIIMLDNMSNEAMLEAVRLINHRSAVEASGNMTLERIREVAALGVDYISVGALTHSVKALDISMNFIQ